MIASLILAAAQASTPGIAVTNSPPPRIIAVPVEVGPPIYAVPRAPSVPPPPAPNIVRGPQERGTIQSYFSVDDYPSAALAMRAQGAVGIRLTIGANGRVIGCAITRSSGSPVLDSATCNLIRRRARYTPAMDSNGNSIVGTIDQHIEWKLPPR
ncbi:MAG TPA: energy transducer TonB [Sphingomicrobium sp.]|nr:energy transducer TonB [Sphingomicrobium sp.]